MKVELLYINGCPNRDKALRMIQDILGELGVSDSAQVVKTLVATYGQAESLKFAGSPTIQVNDVDIEPDHERLTEFGLSCRLYKIRGVEQNLPDPKWLKDAMRKAKKDEDEKAALDREKIEVARFDAKPLPRKYGMGTFKNTKAAKGSKKKGGKKNDDAENPQE